MKKFLTGVALAIVFCLLAVATITTGCNTCQPVQTEPEVMAQRAILQSASLVNVADEIVVATYPDIEGSDTERLEWLAKGACALRVTQNTLRVGWDTTWYWVEEENAGERGWQEWLSLSAPVALHGIQVVKSFGVPIPDEVNAAIVAIGVTLDPSFDVTEFNRQSDACKAALYGTDKSSMDPWMDLATLVVQSAAEWLAGPTNYDRAEFDARANIPLQSEILFLAERARLSEVEE